MLFVALSSVSSFSYSKTDVYGVVNQIVIRAGDSISQPYIGFRLDVREDISQFSGCIDNGTSIMWKIYPSSPVAEYSYQLIQASYEKQLPIRLLGLNGTCDDTMAPKDQFFSVSPWSWPYHIENGYSQ